MKRSVRIRLATLSIAALVMFASNSPALIAADISQVLKGNWTGAIELPGMKLNILLEFSKNESGWVGKIDIPVQNAKGVPLQDIKLSEADVTFGIQGIPGDPKFAGKISEDNMSISGNFTQGGQSFPFSIQREDPAKLAADAGKLNADFEKISAFTDSVRKQGKIPGVALAIIKDDKVVFSKGFGYRNVKDSLPVTSQTIFAIGSCTKAFTTAALGMLVDEGKLDWDKPVKEYLPTFKMYDDFATQQMTPTDLVTHRSGLPRHDLMWYNSTFTRKDIFDRLQYLEPNAGFRSKWQYQNLMYMTAGYLLEQITHDSWENFVKNRIFVPLGMNNSNFSVAESQKLADYALPYRETHDTVRVIPFRNITTAGPAGSINSNLIDMAEWVRFHLNNGRVGDKQLLNDATMTKIHSAQMIMPQSDRYTESVNSAYAMGWMTQAYRGHRMVEHGGNIDGFSAMVTMLPNDNVGVIVLTNLEGTPVPTALVRYPVDILLGLDPVDWNGRIRTQIEAAKKAQVTGTNVPGERKVGTKPSHPLEDYTGDYENPAYGILSVKLTGKTLEASYNQIKSTLEHWHYDVFKAEAPEFEESKMLLTFSGNSKGDIDQVSAPFEPQVKEIVFTRIPPASMRDPIFIKQFVGEYELEGTKITVSTKGDSALTVYVPGQPVYDLVPYQKTEYLLKGLTGFSVAFTVDKRGSVTEAVFHQPNGVFTAKRKS